MPVSHRRAPRGRPRRNSVHKRPNPTRRGLILPSVYTITVTRGRPRRNSVHKRPNLASEGPCHPFVYTIVIPRPFTTQAHSPTVYTNAQNWRREPRSSHSCTLLRSHGATRDATVYTNAPIRRLEALTTHLCTLLRSLAPQESRQVSWSNMSSSSRTWSSSRRRARW